ncbi:MAG: hypothetical protein DCC67_05145 [Planctomycetota bacterium]|nr:MAG: hypothetical protein DCC67_05145 [Planctomycetota bacterium]
MITLGALASLRTIRVSILGAGMILAPAFSAAHEAGEPHVHFQKPARASATAVTEANSTLKFRSPTPASATAPSAPAAADGAASAAKRQQVAKPLAEVASRPANTKAVRQAPAKNQSLPAFTKPAAEGQLAHFRSDNASQAHRVVTLDHSQPPAIRPASGPRLRQAAFLDSYMESDPAGCGFAEPVCGCGEPTCGILEPACGLEEVACGMEPACGLVEPGCAVAEPGCGVLEPGCELVEPGCEILEPGCGCGDLGCDGIACGAAVAPPRPDYWCFPVCLPRLKELTVWAGVHGFKGPRDAPAFGGNADGNFGFQEAVNLGGRAPYVGLLLPQLSYQLGYQAVQSQLSGNSGGSSEDRSQNFVTAGLFRRVPAGVQFGVVWDYQDDDYLADLDFQQIRYEVSVKSRRGREIGFWGAAHTNTATLGSTEFQAVDQFNLFFRFHFREAAELRFWGGGSNDGEGIFGADAYAPLSNRWSLQTGFNYLIPDEDAGVVGSREESWNIFTNLVWHYGANAKASRTNPHRPLFNLADNGYMFIDARP